MTPTEPQTEPTIRAFDQNGNEVLIPREQWRTEILPNMLRESWNQPDQLYQLILNSLNEGFGPEVASAAEHLHTADPLPARGACIWAIVLIAAGQLDEAEAILRAFLTTHGDEGSVLTNLAKVQSLRAQHTEAEATLWHALEVEPNLDHGLAWYASLQQEQGGEPAATAALERVAALPGSWRAHLWLARAALAAGNLPPALDLYREALNRAPQPVPGDFLMQMSGDLGSHGNIAELLDFTAPYFVPEVHGLAVGNNLIKANLDLRRPEPATALIAALTPFNRPDWKSALDFWSTEIARMNTGTITPGQLQIGMLRLDGPIWLPVGAPGWALFGEKPAPRKEAGPSVTFLGGTAESPRQANADANDLAGRLSRALPLFLAEQVELRTAATGRSMLPWAVSQGPAEPTGFVVGSAPWTPEMAVQSVSQAPEAHSDIVVTVHLDASVEPWTAELIFLRTDTGTGVQIGELDAEFPSAHPEQGLPALAEEVMELLGGASQNTSYQAPTGTHFGPYLQRLEQLLAVRCAAMPGVPPFFLQGEADILENNLQASAADAENLASRLLLLETANALDRLRPEATASFRQRLEALLTEAPIAT